MRELEIRGVVEFARGALDRFGDRLAAMARVHAPKTSAGIEQFPARFIEVVHAVGTREHARLCLELPVRRERQPERAKVVGTIHVPDVTESARKLTEELAGSRRTSALRMCEKNRQALA